MSLDKFNSLVQECDRILAEMQKETEFPTSCIYCNKLGWECECLKKNEIEIEKILRAAKVKSYLLKKKRAETAAAMARRRAVRAEQALTMRKLKRQNATVGQAWSLYSTHEERNALGKIQGRHSVMCECGCRRIVLEGDECTEEYKDEDEARSAATEEML